MQTDAQLVEAARADDAEAFAALYDRYADRIHAFCYSRLRDNADAADALQETFINAHWRLQQLDDPAKFRAWLFAISRNTIADLARARGRHERRRDWGPVGGRRRPTDPRNLDMAADQPGLDRGIAAEESAALLWDAAGALQPRDQELLELHLRAGLDGSELADAMDVEPAHVYVMVKRMKDRLSTAVGSLLVARVGRDDCADLDALLGDWNGTFSLAIRSTITRHVESCDTCHKTRRAAIAWESIAAAMPAPPAPAAVRLAVMTAVSSGVIGLTSSATSEGATAATTTAVPPDVDLTDGSDADAETGGGGSAGSSGQMAGLPAVLATTGAYLAIAAVMTAAVLAWPVIRGTGSPDVVVTDVAGVTEDNPPSDGNDSAATDDSADAGNDESSVAVGDTTTSTTSTTTTTLSAVPPQTTTPPTTAAPTTPPTTTPPTTVPGTTSTAATTSSSTTSSSTTTSAPSSTTSESTTTSSTTTSSTTTSSTTTSSTTSTTTTTTLPPVGPIFSGSSDPIDFPAGVATVDFTFANTGDAPMSWAASTLAPFTVNLPKGTLLPGTDITLTITFDTTVAPDDYFGILDLNTDGGDFDIVLRVTSPPDVSFGFTPAEIWEDAGACAGGQSGLPVQTVVAATATDNSAVVSVVATWNGSSQTTALSLEPGTGLWTGVIGPYTPAGGSMVDLVLVEATDDSGNVTGALGSLTVSACPA